MPTFGATIFDSLLTLHTVELATAGIAPDTKGGEELTRRPPDDDIGQRRMPSRRTANRSR